VCVSNRCLGEGAWGALGGWEQPFLLDFEEPGCGRRGNSVWGCVCSASCVIIDLVQIGGGGKGEQVNTVFLALREWLLLLIGSGISDEIV
jgi:hypothetical protein